MMQGDAYAVRVKLQTQDEIVTSNLVSDVEIVLGTVTKTYLKKEITYDAEKEEWLFPLSQNETFALAGSRRMQVRVKFTDDTVIGKNLGVIDVTNSLSKEVL